jgi:hypothetical protein
VVAVVKIEAGKVLGFPTLIEELRNERERISILDCDFVETTVVDAQP